MKSFNIFMNITSFTYLCKLSQSPFLWSFVSIHEALLSLYKNLNNTIFGAFKTADYFQGYDA